MISHSGFNLCIAKTISGTTKEVKENVSNNETSKKETLILYRLNWKTVKMKAGIIIAA
jgi:hypothetical protein